MGLNWHRSSAMRQEHTARQTEARVTESQKAFETQQSLRQTKQSGTHVDGMNVGEVRESCSDEENEEGGREDEFVAIDIDPARVIFL